MRSERVPGAAGWLRPAPPVRSELPDKHRACPLVVAGPFVGYIADSYSKFSIRASTEETINESQ